MPLRIIFTTRWSNVNVAASVFSDVIVFPPGALVENEPDGFFLAMSGRFCVLDWPGVCWLTLPWLPGELSAGFADVWAGVAVGEAGVTAGGGSVATPGLAPG